MSRFGEVLEEQFPKVKLRVNRRTVPDVLAGILAAHTIEDVSVEAPPLEEVIAEMFSLAGEQIAANERAEQIASG